MIRTPSQGQGTKWTLIHLKQTTSGYINLDKVRRASRVETTISYPKGQMPCNTSLSIISNTSSYGYRNRYIYLKEPSLQARSTPLQKTNCKSLSERPVLKSAMVPQFHARSEQLTVNADARNATAPRLPPMLGSQPLEISTKEYSRSRLQITANLLNSIRK